MHSELYTGRIQSDAVAAGAYRHGSGQRGDVSPAEHPFRQVSSPRGPRSTAAPTVHHGDAHLGVALGGQAIVDAVVHAEVHAGLHYIPVRRMRKHVKRFMDTFHAQLYPPLVSEVHVYDVLIRKACVFVIECAPQLLGSDCLSI